MYGRDFEPVFGRIQALARASSLEVELLVERSEKLSISFQKKQINKFDSSASHCAGLRVIQNGFAGYAFSENLEDEVLLSTFGMAVENVRFAAKGGAPSTPARLLTNPGFIDELGELYNQSLSRISIEDKIERARVLEATALDVDPRIASVPFGAYTEIESELQILTTVGVRRRQRSVLVGGSAFCLAKEGDESRVAGEAIYLRDASKFEAWKVAQASAVLALSKLGSVQPETGCYAVVLERDTASQFFELIAEYFSAKAVHERRSIFADLKGKAMASSKLTVTDDPFHRGGLGSRSFDSEGAACQMTSLIEDGVLLNFLTNSTYARQLNLPSTASAVRGARSELGIGISNLLVQPGAERVESLLNFSPKMILITGLKGFHSGFRASSGDFSLQAEGELWENGKRVKPLCNFVVSGNVLEFLKGIAGLSDRLSIGKSNVVAPDILVRELSIAGK
jgi:PmbA protein